MEYRESQSSLLLNAAVLLSTLSMGISSYWMLATDQGTVVAFILGISALLMLGVLICFGRLVITINARGARANFGPFARNLAWSEIERVEAGRYNWLQFGGWGLRGDMKGGMAYSLPVTKHQLVFHLKNGKRLHVTIKNPAAAMEAVNEHRG